MDEQKIQWDRNIEHDAFVCRVIVPCSWLIVESNFKVKLRLWWWLTRLAWSLPK